MTKIILLDIDGALVQPLGYRAALRATVKHFLGSHIEIEEDVLTNLEKRGISSEWDMAPLIIASYWNSVLLQHPQQNLPDDVFSAAIQLQEIKLTSPIEIIIPEFKLIEGQYPSESALRENCFLAIPLELRKNLLFQTRDIKFSHTMKIFQHFTLGSENFAKTYLLPIEIETESFLLKHDVSNINDEVREKLLQHHVAGFTARPSRIPVEVAESIVGYAPEAELALELVNLKNIPLIAFGKLEYLASQYQLDPATLVKPSPFQALAGTLAAYIGDEWTALQSAYHWLIKNELNENFKQLPKEFELIVVEDTMGGIRSVQSAGEVFQKAGFDVSIKSIGLTSGSKAKADAFEKAGIEYFDAWEEIITNLEI